MECVNIGDSENEDFRLTSDYGVECESSYYKVWVLLGAIPLLLIVGFGYPAFVSISLIYYRRKKFLKKRKILYLFGFIYFAFKPNFFFWDMLNLLKKVLIILILVMFANEITYSNAIYPGIMILIIIIASTCLQLYFQPYKSKY